MKHKYGRFSRISSKSKNDKHNSASRISAWQLLGVMFATVFIPWGIYVLLHPSITGGKILSTLSGSTSSGVVSGTSLFTTGGNVTGLLIGDFHESINKMKASFSHLQDAAKNNHYNNKIIGSNIYGNHTGWRESISYKCSIKPRCSTGVSILTILPLGA